MSSAHFEWSLVQTRMDALNAYNLVVERSIADSTLFYIYFVIKHIKYLH